jgi:hypothetical protein
MSVSSSEGRQLNQEGGISEQAHHHSYMGEIAVAGSEELIKLGWECGFG